VKNIGQIVKQAQMVQQQIAKMQEEIAAAIVTGQAGGGMVEVTMNGNYVVQQVRIDPKSVDPQDVEMLEDLIVAALNDARKQVQAMSDQRMAGVTGGVNLGGMNIPGLIGM
jgi:DNA-binding YbaB/EbfC family protein